MVVMRFSSPARRRRSKYKVELRVVAVEGLPPLTGVPMVAAVEVAWKRPPRVGALSYLMGRKKPARRVSSRRPVEGVSAVRWGPDDEASLFENVCRFRESELAHGFDSNGSRDISFSVLYGNDGEEGGKLSKLENIGTTMGSLADWAKEFQSLETGERAEEKKLKKQLPIIFKREGLTSYGVLHVTITFRDVRPAEVTQEASLCEEHKGRLRELSYDSGSSDGGNMVLDQPIQLDEDIMTISSDQSHCSSSGRSSPDSDSNSKSWLSWPKRSKINDAFRVLKDGETRKTPSPQEDTVYDNSKEESSESDQDADPIGYWRSKEFFSRDKQTKLKVETFFASIDQRDPSAGGESACTSIVAVIANALHNNQFKTPTQSEFDALIREGSSEWQNLCNNNLYIQRFPDKHFDLDTVLEAKTWAISVLPEKSYIGFFQPESFQSLHEAMSFNDVWEQIINDAGEESKVYIVSWNDHFFILKLEENAYYIMDTLGERLYEGCKKAYILRFDDSSEMHRWQENKGSGDNEELICRGTECCREFINRFLAAIPVQEELELEKKGVGTFSALHQRLQIELHLTQASTNRNN